MAASGFGAVLFVEQYLHAYRCARKHQSSEQAHLLFSRGRDYYNNTPMPGYTPYIYPHPLTRSYLYRGGQQAQNSGSDGHLNKREQRKDKKVKRWKWGRAKENSANETAKQVGPDHE